MQQITSLRSKIERFNEVKGMLEDCETYYEMAKESGDDEELWQETADSLNPMMKELQAFELETLLNGEYDANNAIISIHPGAGGTEGQDWAEMLYRMYVHWAENHHYGVTVLDYLAGEEAGIKSVTLLIKGENAFGYLKAERGVHRLVRISPFDASGRRHTSFAALEVMPEVEHDDSIEIRSERFAYRHLSLDRCRRAAYQYDRLGSAYYAYPDRCRRPVPKRALADSKPCYGDEDVSQ